MNLKSVFGVILMLVGGIVALGCVLVWLVGGCFFVLWVLGTPTEIGSVYVLSLIAIHAASMGLIFLGERMIQDSKKASDKDKTGKEREAGLKEDTDLSAEEEFYKD